MTTGPTPTPPPRNEGEYARKLALAILSTLEQKGILSRLDVDTILHAAHRAASPPLPARPAAPVGPALLGTRWVKPGDPSSAAPPVAPIAGQPEVPDEAGPARTAPAAATPGSKPAAPPVIDFTLD
ncbi:hypothetical protein [Deinococcus sp. Leaf326]|uniref:hypothetical protein n=1 Tax=Deinococcus sp. Leaf326 TaxID=1736338 RepID=UPI000A4B3D27|nr:hypothetical protein [Deinococcus sp. Leaf326]